MSTKSNKAKIAAKPISKAAKRAEAIKSAVNARTGNGLVVTTTRDRSIVIQRIDGRVNKLALVGLPVAPLEEYLRTQPKPRAQLAHGIMPKDAPQSAAAVRDQAKAAKGKAATPRTAKAAKGKAPSKGADRAYKLGGTKNAAKADTWRHHMLTTIMGNKTTSAAKAAHEKSGKFSSNKLDFNWAAAQGYIAYTDK